MAITIGGLSQKKANDLLGISRSTMSRFRANKDWPGDDASWEMIEAYVSLHLSTKGRKPKREPQPKRTDDPGADVQRDMVEADEEIAQLRELLASQDSELKATQIEKNKTYIERYQQACLEIYRELAREELRIALDVVYDEIANLDLSKAQLENVGTAIKKAIAKLKGDDKQWQPELL